MHISLATRWQRAAFASGGFREIWQIAYPLIIMGASHIIMQFTNRVFLSINSTEDVAAALPAGILYFTLFCFFMVTAGFTSVLVAQYHGAGDMVNCVKTVWNGFYFALFAMAVIVFVIPPLGHAILAYGGHPPEIMAKEIEYFDSLIPSGAVVCLGCPFFAFFSGRGKTKFVAVVNLAGCGINIFLDYALIFGNFGLPSFGITGAGIATVVSSIFSTAIVMITFLTLEQKSFPTRQYRKFDWSLLKKIMLFGAPAGTQAVADVGGWTALTFMLGHLTPESLAATTIALAINNLSFMPLLGFSDAAAIVVGQYIGRRRLHIANRVPYRAWFMVSFYMIFTGLVYLIFPITLFKMFSPNHAGTINFATVMQTGQLILIFAALFNFFDAAKFIFSGGLRGAGDTHAVLYISLFATWVMLVPGTALLIFVGHASIITVWGYITFCTMIESFIVFWRFRTARWRNISLVH